MSALRVPVGEIRKPMGVLGEPMGVLRGPIGALRVPMGALRGPMGALRGLWKSLFVACMTLLSASAIAGPMGADDARHLLNRTGFDAQPAQIESFAGLSRSEAVERLLTGVRTSARTPAPASALEYVSYRQMRSLAEEDRKKLQRQLIDNALDLKNWWVAEMISTPSPLTERMTLFWHNHFTSSLQKVRSSALMYRQNLLLREHALGNFGVLLHAVGKDPAMLVYLDTAINRRGAPNENFAREVMELFTLGEGNYTEQDVSEAARAFTGWSLDPASGEFLWRPFAHDSGTKSVLGRSGEFSGVQVLDLLLARPETAEFIVAKLWKEFVSPRVDVRETARIARLFRQSGYEIKTALRALLASDAFYAQSNRGALIKSPVDLVIGTMRQFRVGFSDPLPITLLLRRLGQDLFSPPNVKGWPGGDAWINSSTLLARRQFLERLFRVDENRMQATRAVADMNPMRQPGEGREGRERFMRAALDIHFSGSDWLRQFEGRGAQIGLQRVLLALPPAADRAEEVQGVDLIRRLTADPAYQLK